jgi:hypothetical protein
MSTTKGSVYHPSNIVMLVMRKVLYRFGGVLHVGMSQSTSLFRLLELSCFDLLLFETIATDSHNDRLELTKIEQRATS